MGPIVPVLRRLHSPMNATPLSPSPTPQTHPPQRTPCQDCATQASCPLAQFQPVLAAQVLPKVTERTLERGAVLQRQGSESKFVRVVKSGSVLLCREGAGGAGLPLAIASAGQVSGVSRLIEFPATLTIVAMADTRVCELSVSAIERLGVMSHAEFRRPLAEAVFRTLGVLADWARVTRLPGVRAQLAGALMVMGTQQKSERVRLPGHAVLGELLGVTRESVARGLAALEREGCIKRLGRTYCELHMPCLKRLTGDA